MGWRTLLVLAVLLVAPVRSARAQPAAPAPTAPAVGPVASFETDADNPFRPNDLVATRVAAHASEGTYSLKVQIDPQRFACRIPVPQCASVLPGTWGWPQCKPEGRWGRPACR